MSAVARDQQADDPQRAKRQKDQAESTGRQRLEPVDDLLKDPDTLIEDVHR